MTQHTHSHHTTHTPLTSSKSRVHADPGGGGACRPPAIPIAACPTDAKLLSPSLPSLSFPLSALRSLPLHSPLPALHSLLCRALGKKYATNPLDFAKQQKVKAPAAAPAPEPEPAAAPAAAAGGGRQPVPEAYAVRILCITFHLRPPVLVFGTHPYAPLMHPYA